MAGWFSLSLLIFYLLKFINLPFQEIDLNNIKINYIRINLIKTYLNASLFCMKNKICFKKYLHLSGFLLSFIALLAIVFTPVSANSFFLGGVSLKDEKEMGDRFNVMLRSHMPMVEDPEVVQYVSHVLKRLSANLNHQPFAFTSSVILHNALNAFAIPGGYVFVFTGLLMNLDSEDEFAGVLAHELAHVTQRHVAQRMERAQFFTIGALLAAIAGIAVGGPAGAAAILTAQGASQSAMLNYSRLDESESDNLGLQYLTKAGYSPWGMVGAFKILRQKNWLSGVGVPTYLSTHPAIGDRINNLTARITAMPDNLKSRKMEKSRFQRVKTLLWARYGDEQAALQKFSGKDPLSLMGRGIVYSRQNKIPEATKAFDEALAANSQDSLILREAGIFHFRKGDMTRAEKLLRGAMKKDPGDYMASFFYGRMLDESGKSKDAHQFYNDVLRRVPEEPEVHEAYAHSLGNAGNHYLAYIHLAYSSIYSHNKKMAEKYFKQAKSLAEKAPDKRPFNKLEKIYSERKQIWEKS